MRVEKIGYKAEVVKPIINIGITIGEQRIYIFDVVESNTAEH